MSAEQSDEQNDTRFDSFATQLGESDLEIEGLTGVNK
jgi:hypothetical protein